MSPAILYTRSITTDILEWPRLLKEIYLSKALTCMNLFLYKQKCIFIKETDTFGHIVVRTFYSSHMKKFMQVRGFERYIPLSQTLY